MALVRIGEVKLGLPEESAGLSLYRDERGWAALVLRAGPTVFQVELTADQSREVAELLVQP